jgi:Tfp pilus assembly protein PilV
MTRPDRPDRHGRRGIPAGARARSGAGFSLIEVLFALTFLAVGIMAVAAMIPAGTRGVSQSRVVTSGLMAAQVKMEQLRGTPYTALTAGSFSDTTSVFTRTWVVTDSIPMAGCKKIDVTSRWMDNRGAQTTQLTSYVTR